MGGDQRVVHLPPGTVRRRRLALQHVEGGPRDAGRAASARQQRPLVHDVAARRVDELRRTPSSRPSSRAPIIPRVSGVDGTASTTKSDSPSTRSSSDSGSTSTPPLASAGLRFTASTRIPKAAARRAVSRPIAPNPTIPIVAPRSWGSSKRSHARARWPRHHASNLLRQRQCLRHYPLGDGAGVDSRRAGDDDVRVVPHVEVACELDSRHGKLDPAEVGRAAPHVGRQPAGRQHHLRLRQHRVEGTPLAPVGRGLLHGPQRRRQLLQQLRGPVGHAHPPVNLLNARDQVVRKAGGYDDVHGLFGHARIMRRAPRSA